MAAAGPWPATTGPRRSEQPGPGGAVSPPLWRCSEHRDRRGKAQERGRAPAFHERLGLFVQAVCGLSEELLEAAAQPSAGAVRALPARRAADTERKLR